MEQKSDNKNKETLKKILELEASILDLCEKMGDAGKIIVLEAIEKAKVELFNKTPSENNQNHITDFFSQEKIILDYKTEKKINRRASIGSPRTLEVEIINSYNDEIFSFRFPTSSNIYYTYKKNFHFSVEHKYNKEEIKEIYKQCTKKKFFPIMLNEGI